MRLRTITCLAAAVAASSALPGPAPAAGKRFHTIHQRPKLRMPAPHKLAVKRRTVRIPGRPHEVYVYMQLRRPDGKLSPVVTAGRPVEYAGADGTRIVRAVVTARLDRKHHRLRYTVAVRNLAVSRAYAKHTKVGFLITVRYR
jgi:hypothetical protein